MTNFPPLKTCEFHCMRCDKSTTHERERISDPKEIADFESRRPRGDPEPEGLIVWKAWRCATCGNRSVVESVPENAPVWTPTKFNPAMKFPTGFGPVKMRKGDRIQVRGTLKTLAEFRPNRFIVPSEHQHHFALHQITIAGKPQFACGTPIPAAVFSEAATDTLFAFTKLLKGEEIAVDVECLDYIHVLRFEAVLNRSPQVFTMKRLRRQPVFSAVFIGAGIPEFEPVGAEPS